MLWEITWTLGPPSIQYRTYIARFPGNRDPTLAMTRHNKNQVNLIRCCQQFYIITSFGHWLGQGPVTERPGQRWSEASQMLHHTVKLQRAWEKKSSWTFGFSTAGMGIAVSNKSSHISLYRNVCQINRNIIHMLYINTYNIKWYILYNNKI